VETHIINNTDNHNRYQYSRWLSIHSKCSIWLSQGTELIPFETLPPMRMAWHGECAAVDTKKKKTSGRFCWILRDDVSDVPDMLMFNDVQWQCPKVRNSSPSRTSRQCAWRGMESARGQCSIPATLAAIASSVTLECGCGNAMDASRELESMQVVFDASSI
jgi:hypothetical protein